MKKSIKLLTCVSVAVVLVCLLAVSAFAAAKSGSFTVTILGVKYTGDYNAALYVYPTYTDCTLEITNYTGYFDAGGDAIVDGAVRGVKADGTTEQVAPIYSRGPLDCGGTFPYSLKPGTYVGLTAECSYDFFKTLCTLEESASL